MAGIPGREYPLPMHGRRGAGDLEAVVVVVIMVGVVNRRPAGAAVVTSGHHTL